MNNIQNVAPNAGHLYDFSSVSDNDLLESISRLETAGLKQAAQAAINEAQARGLLGVVDFSDTMTKADILELAQSLRVKQCGTFSQRLNLLITACPVDVSYPHGAYALAGNASTPDAIAYESRRG